MQRMIDCGTWDDPWFADLEPDGKLLFLYLLTNRRSTAAGAFEITIRQMAFETGMDQGRIGEVLSGFGERVQWWPDHQIIWVRNFFKRQAANDKFIISAKRHIAELPADVQVAIATVYPDLVSEGVSKEEDTHGIPTSTGMERVSVVESSSSDSGEVGIDEGSGEGEDAAGADAPPPAPKKRAARIPDTFEITDTMREWAVERGLTPLQIDRQTETFVNHWTAESGPKASKLDWNAAWRVWVSREFGKPANVTRIGGAANGRASPGESIATRQLRESRERREREQGRTA